LRIFICRSGQKTVAAAEVAVGLALIVTIFRSRNSINVDLLSSLKG